MESIKHKLAILALVLCLALLAALAWYLIAGLPGGSPGTNGTLVEGIFTWGRMAAV